MKAIKFLTEAFFTLALIIISAATFSCSKSSNLRSIEEENLFSLNYGTYEDELQLFSLDAAGQINTNIVMKEGFFFISDDYAKKIMQFTSFGDLTGIIYNPNTNPEPSFVRKIGNSQDNDSNIKSATQSAREHKFNSIEDIAIDSNKNIFVVDQISPERQETDPKTNLILREIVLKFSNDGKFSNYYGQEGIGGTPFPFIKNIFTTGGNELVVTSLSPEGYTVYWFDKNGALKWKIPVLNSYLPEPESDEAGDYFVTIDKIVPDQNTPTLYIKTDYYKTVNDQELNVQSGIEYKMTLLHVFDIEKESFDSPIEIPPYEDVITDRFTKLVYKVPYEFLGITDSNAFFFMVPGSQGLVLEILQGQKIIKRHISYNMNDVVYTNFSLSKTGIISGLIAKEDKADVVWWRTDSLVEKH